MGTSASRRMSQRGMYPHHDRKAQTTIWSHPQYPHTELRTTSSHVGLVTPFGQTALEIHTVRSIEPLQAEY